MELDGPKGSFLLGSVAEFRNGPLEFFQRLDQEYDGICSVRLGPVKGVFTSSPKVIKDVLATKNKSFKKGTSYKELKHFLKDGLLTSEGETWFKQRRLAQPSFYKKTVESFFNIMVKYSERTVAKWEAEKKFEALPDMNNLTLAAIGEAVFNKDLTSESGNVGDSLSFMIEETNTRMWNIVNWPIWFPTKNNNKFHKGMKTINKIVFDLIKEKRGQDGTDGDLTQMLIDAEDADSGEKMNDQEVRDELMTIFVAGHETTALALSWALYEISKHPEVERKIKEELELVLEGKPMTVESVWKLSYIRAVLDETMRLYPPAWVIGRVAKEDLEVGGVKMKKGEDILISTYAAHRSPRLWDQPDEFLPERFLGDNKKAIDKYAYFPFGGGPRICIGEQFAIMEMVIAIATFYRKGTPVLIDKIVNKVPLVTLRPDKAIKFEWKAN